MQEIVYHTNYKLENEYWWFVARKDIIGSIIDRHCDLKPGDTVLDAGCGTGGFAEYLAEKYNVVCLDTSPIALEYCKKRGLKNLYNTTLENFPKNGWSIKAVFMLDVIEHIEDHKAVVKQVFNVLPEGGFFIASVPAYQWLWSKHDEVHMHYRRYTKPEFVKLLKDQGFEIKYSTYFNSLLFLPAVLVRFMERFFGVKHEGPVDEVSPVVNSIFTKVFRLERGFLKALKFPFGLSIIVIAKKTASRKMNND